MSDRHKMQTESNKKYDRIPLQSQLSSIHDNEQMFKQGNFFSDLMDIQCSRCQINLNKQPTFIVRNYIEYRHTDQGFFPLCTICFKKWSEGQLFELPKTLQYYLIDSQNQIQQNSLNWTLHEVSYLFQCVQKFGFDSWKNIERQLQLKTGKQRYQQQLQHIYSFYYQTFLKNNQNMNFRLKHQVQTINFPKPKCVVLDFDYSRLNSHQVKYFQQYNQIIKTQLPYQHLRKQANNYDQYFFGLLLLKPQVQEVYDEHGNVEQSQVVQIYHEDGRIPEMSAKIENNLSLASKWLKESNQTSYEIKRFRKQMAKEYEIARKRAHRSSRSINNKSAFIRASSQGPLHEDPQVKHLLQSNNPSINTFLTEFGSLKKQRQKIMQQINQWNKNKLSQPEEEQI